MSGHDGLTTGSGVYKRTFNKGLNVRSLKGKIIITVTIYISVRIICEIFSFWFFFFVKTMRILYNNALMRPHHVRMVQGNERHKVTTISL